MGRSIQRLYEFGPFRLDESEVSLTRDGLCLPVKPKVFQLLLLLVQNAGHMLTKEQLMAELWPNAFVEEHNLAVQVSDLRKVLGPQHPYIQTVQRHGYRFAGEVQQLQCGDSPLTGVENGSGTQIDRSPRTKAVAVLPFKTLTASSADDYLGLGLADAIITKLSGLKTIIVRPTSSVRRYTNGIDPKTAGRELQVELVLDGSVRKIGDRVRVTVQFISVADGATIWAGKYDESFSDILTLEDSISEQSASALALKLTQDENRSLTKRPTENIDAYVSYMKGNLLFDRRSVRDLTRSIDFFQEAIRLDPDCAMAHVRIGRARFSLYTIGVLPKEILTEIHHSISLALQLDNDLPEAHAVMAELLLFKDGDWAGAELEYEKAVKLDPGCASAREYYSRYLALDGRFEEALEQNKAARILEPASLITNMNFARIRFLARDFEGAIRETLKVYDLDPTYATVHYFMGVNYDELKEHDKAQISYEEYERLQPNNAEVLAGLCRSYGLAGKTESARAMLEKILEDSNERYIPPYYVCLAYLGLGEIEESLKWLEKSSREGDSNILGIKVDARIDPLRGEPRFQVLYDRVFWQSRTTSHQDSQTFVNAARLSAR